VVASTDPEYAAAWGVDRIGSQAAHDKGIRGAGVKIAVLDTGIDYNHPDLAANVKGGDNFISLDPDFHDYWDDSSRSHGTHVAGIIAAIRNGSGVVGVAPEAELYAVKVLDGAGFGDISSLVAGIEWAIANGMHVINISAGLVEPSLALEQACRSAWEAGILVVAAAGNTYGGPVAYPAAYDSVVAVSATDPQDAVIDLSSTGPEVNLAAPGYDVYSTASGGGYKLTRGTSQAAPHVTGVAALVLSSGTLADQDGDGLLTVQDLRLRLQKTAKDLGTPGQDAVSGFGLVQAATAVGIEQRQAVSATLTVTKGRPSADQQTITLSGGSYHVSIVNSGLTSVAVKVLRGGVPVRSGTYRFKGRGTAPLSFNIDGGTEVLTVVLTPFGRPGTKATVTATPF
jgi:subtilisin